MVTDHIMNEMDEALLDVTLQHDPVHEGTTTAFFKQPGTLTTVLEDEDGPILFARRAKSMRVDIQFIHNDDKHRNAEALKAGMGPLCDGARAAGFTEIVFTTSNPELQKFCEKVLGYETVPDTFVLRKFL